jgi:hypothetical protein
VNECTETTEGAFQLLSRSFLNALRLFWPHDYLDQDGDILMALMKTASWIDRFALDYEWLIIAL